MRIEAVKGGEGEEGLGMNIRKKGSEAVRMGGNRAPTEALSTAFGSGTTSGFGMRTTSWCNHTPYGNGNYNIITPLANLSIDWFVVYAGFCSVNSGKLVVGFCAWELSSWRALIKLSWVRMQV